MLFYGFTQLLFFSVVYCYHRYTLVQLIFIINGKASDTQNLCARQILETLRIETAARSVRVNRCTQKERTIQLDWIVGTGDYSCHTKYGLPRSVDRLPDIHLW